MCTLALAACGLSMPLSPRARLHVVARGAVPFGEIESQIHEVTEALTLNATLLTRLLRESSVRCHLALTHSRLSTS